MDLQLFAWLFTSPGTKIPYTGGLLKWYGCLIGGAVLIGVYLCRKLARQRHIDPDILSNLAIWLTIAAIPMARLYYVLFEWKVYARHPEQIVKIWEGGIAIHGAIIGGIIAAVIFAKIKRLSFWNLADIVAPALALGQTIGRWGNFFNSEAFGTPTNLPWKLYIPVDSRPPQYLNIEYFHPTFLYESLWNLLVFGFLLRLFNWDTRRSKLKTGTIFLVYLLVYSMGRFVVEGLRTDSLMFGDMRIAQVISLIGMGIGLFSLMWLYIRNQYLPDRHLPDTIPHNLHSRIKV